jgi:hypothetical protein
MQQVQLSGGKDSRPWSSSSGDGVYEDPPGVSLRAQIPGSPYPVGWADMFVVDSSIEAQLPDGQSIEWDAVTLLDFRVPQPIHLMLIEGAAPSWLFLGGELFVLLGGGATEPLYVKGPFILLALEAPPLHEVPYTFRKVVLGSVRDMKGATLREILPALLFSLSRIQGA